MSDLEVHTLYGVDGTRNGWVVARATADLSEVTIHLVDDLEALFWRVVRDHGLLAIDVPIGLPSSQPRACDRASRALLGRPRASSVFPAPMRSAIEAETYGDASSLNYVASGRKLNRQTFNLLPKIREVDALIWPERQRRIFEVHPEVSFMTFGSRERGLVTNKKKRDGRAERQRILSECMPAIDVAALPKSLSGNQVTADDCHDALACLVTASRIAAGRAIRVPDNMIEIDERGLRMEILA